MNHTMEPFENQLTSKAQMKQKTLKYKAIMTNQSILIGSDIIGQLRSDTQRVMTEEEI
jgi:hypothetical protein